MNRTIRRAAFAAASIAAAVTVAACGTSTSAGTNPQNMPGMPGSAGMTGMAGMTSSSSTTTAPASAGKPAAGPHNAADVAFATGMIPHHGQAITMAEMATSQATNPQVKSLAAAIKAAQGPEIATMSAWLTGWGQPVPATTGGPDMSGMDTGMSRMDGTGGMVGMMTTQEMQQLTAATGAAFDRMWLQMMIRHHQGAVTMAQTELATGQNGDAKQLAQQIIDAQNKEIDTMTGLLPTITG
jgi:uncharacterized protein (DUF305 family)